MMSSSAMQARIAAPWRFMKMFPIALLLGGLIGGLYYALNEPPWLTYENMPFPPEKQQLRAGDEIQLRVKRCSSANTIKSYTLAHELERVDTEAPSILLRHEIMTIRPGCYESIARGNVVPHGTPPGVYRVAGVAVVQGMLRTIPIPRESQTFRVVE